MLKFEVCSYKTFCVRRYLVKVDRNEKLSKRRDGDECNFMTCHDIRDGANRVRVDVLLKWKLASWKVKGMVFVHCTSPTRIIRWNKRQNRTASASVTASLLQRVLWIFKDAWRSQSRTENVTLSMLDFDFFFFFSSWMINFQLKFSLFEQKIYLFVWLLQTVKLSRLKQKFSFISISSFLIIFHFCQLLLNIV